MKKVLTFIWKRHYLDVLDQRLLPHRIYYVRCRDHMRVAECIRDMVVRGAPAIGCVAAYGMALAASEKKLTSAPALKKHLDGAFKALSETRPTAVNLFWALSRMKGIYLPLLRDPVFSVNDIKDRLECEAGNIYSEDLSANLAMGEYGASLLRGKNTVITHCNAGALATSGHGTAVGVIRTAYKQGKIKKVFVDETRPYLQGARLTAWELDQEGIPYELITDNMAGHFMKTEHIDAVFVGADRIAGNGDAANKIGTYSLSILAKYHRIPFYVVAPFSTVDLNLSSGRDIPIEERSAEEVVRIKDYIIAPKNAKARHPAFDVTPADLIFSIVTERGIAKKPVGKNLRRLSSK